MYKELAKACLGLGLIFSVPLAGCQESKRNSNETEARKDWETVCIGRLLLSLPQSTHFAEGTLQSDAIYTFQGIANTKAWGEVNIGDTSLSETFPTSNSNLKVVMDSGKADLRPAEYHKRAIENAKEDVAEWRKLAAAAKSPEAALQNQEILAEKEVLLKTLIYRSQVTGVATTIEKSEFAIRTTGDRYSVGYWDSMDQRIRTFQGPLINLSPENPEAAARELRRWQAVYRSRLPTEIPATPGFCTSFGFIAESNGPTAEAQAKVAFRLKKHPNLLFFLSMKPSTAKGSFSILDLPDLAIDKAQLDLIGIKARHGADEIQILGSPGRVYAQEYGPNCASKDDCRPADQAYEIHAETFGQAGRLDRPHLTLYMVAANSDEYKAKRKALPNNPSYNTPERPALKGHVPPPYKVGREIFDQVLSSIRIRPGAVAVDEKQASKK